MLPQSEFGVYHETVQAGTHDPGMHLNSYLDVMVEV